MTGVDTNIIVRLLTGDDMEQFLKAKEIFSAHQIYITDTVILETEWVLRFAYKFSPAEIRTALLRLLGLPNVHVSNPGNLAHALRLHEQGLDFSDAMHLVANQGQDCFFTFDKAFARKAGNLTDCPVRIP